MIDPSLTLVWRRRTAAAVVDLALGVGVLVVLAWLQVERFTRDPGGFFSPDDLDRLATLQRTVNRSVEVGDTRYVLAGGELVMTLLIAALTAVAVYVVVPGTTGTSPGKRLFGLRVVTTRGGVVGPAHAATRAVVGVVDLLPVIVPWAVGAAVARRSPLRQRLGDKAAGTAVVDARRRLIVIADTDGSAAPDQASAPTAAPAAGADDPAAAGIGGGPDRGEPVGTGAGWLLDDVVRPMPLDATRAQRRPSERRTEAERTAPPPQHRGVDRRAVDPSATSSPLGPVGGGWPRPRAEKAPVWDPAAVGRPIVASAALPAAPTAPPAAAGHLRRRADDPRPAPTGTASGTATGAPSGAPSGAPEADLGRAGPGDDRDLEPARTSAAPSAAEAATASTDDLPGTAPATASTAWVDEPVWNDDWQAWLFFDRSTDRWHRHDPAAGTWDPIG